MAGKSKIEWCDASWNPIVGCSIVSPGCTNCYAMRQAARLENIDAKHHLMLFAEHAHLDASHPEGRDPKRTALLDPTTHYAGTTREVNGKPVWTGKVALAPESVLLAPLRWKRPRSIFVNSMGDLFHEGVLDAWIDRVFAVAILAKAVGRAHMFISLTKRARRQREYFGAGQRALRERWAQAALDIGITVGDPEDADAGACAIANSVNGVLGDGRNVGWPLSNLILGVSAERQQEADERIGELLMTSAAVRVASLEPLLAPIKASAFLGKPWVEMISASRPGTRSAMQVRGLDGVIVGGESGPGARPMHPDWARAIRDQCAAAGVPFFFKQWGEFAPSAPEKAMSPHSGWMALRGGLVQNKDARLLYPENGAAFVERTGKRRAGRLLDGREHNGLPW